MILDNNGLIFSGTAAAPYQAITATAASTNVYNATALEDLGASGSGIVPQLAVYVGTTFATLTSLQVQFQTSPDSNTWTTAIETDTIPVANLVAGAKLMAVSWPHRSVVVATALPQYYRFNFVVTGSSASAGTVAAVALLGRDDWPEGLSKSGFSVAS